MRTSKEEDVNDDLAQRRACGQRSTHCIYIGRSRLRRIPSRHTRLRRTSRRRTRLRRTRSRRSRRHLPRATRARKKGRMTRE